MSIRHGLLALLAEQPAHGYGLKSSFEHSTAGAWPLNVGQVYSTLSRLERDGLVEAQALGVPGVPSAAGPERDQEGTAVAADDRTRRAWRITEAGHAALTEWYATPVIDDPPARDELTIKVLLAIAAETVDVSDLLQRQRAETLERLQRYTRQKAQADADTDLPWLLLLDALILKGRAEVDWLDLCEQRLRQRDA